MRFFKLITMGTQWMWTRIFGIDLKIMIILRLAKLSVKGKFIVTVCFQFLKKKHPILQFFWPDFQVGWNCFWSKLWKSSSLRVSTNVKKNSTKVYNGDSYPGWDYVEVTELIILEWYFILYVFRKPYDMAETRINCAIVAAKQELSRAYNFEEWKKDNLKK